MLRNLGRCRQFTNLICNRSTTLQRRVPGCVSRCASSTANSPSTQLVIFDKDGTLIDYHYTWAAWTEDFADRIVSESQRISHDRIYEMLGYSPDTRKFVMGVTNGTKEEICIEMSELLQEVGHSQKEAKDIFEYAFIDCAQTSDDTVKAIDEPLKLIETLKGNGIKIAVCTADTRSNTLQALQTIGIADHVDMVVCSDDVGSKPKPDPHNAHWICSGLGVDPSQAVMVGDSQADVGMGRTAGFGASIGVLSGLCGKSELKDADHVVPSIAHILPKILPGASGTSSACSGQSMI